ncbi:hypothetical protein QTH97_14115 [Variovorax sp. J22R24]|uniref:hypothetical protein n=1 Tax=Variovorax gracilis TaxID=3053502 RepID=UPI0025775E3A|nr:hypothetical protein [Variovorax sp. J22R24]MDM0106075.1 hypothetical protein [Variovorax sp. J22R24]
MNRHTATALFVHASDLDVVSLLALWPKSITGKVIPLGASAFGDLFFQRPEGGVEKLDVLRGGVHYAASSLEEFKLLMNSRYWRDANLMSHGIHLAAKRGIARKRGHFFGFGKHPSHSGRIDWTSLMSLEATAWHAICAKALDCAR